MSLLKFKSNMKFLLVVLVFLCFLYDVECANLRTRNPAINPVSINSRTQEEARRKAAKERVIKEFEAARERAARGGNNKVFAKDKTTFSMVLVEIIDPNTGKSKFKYLPSNLV